MRCFKSCLWWLCLFSGVLTLPAITVWLIEYILMRDAADE